MSLLEELSSMFLNMEFTTDTNEDSYLESVNSLNMTYSEFKRRVDHNTTVLKKAIAEKEKLIRFTPDLYTMTTEPGELHSSILFRKGPDLLPSVYYGALANVESTGVDAYKITATGDIINLEFKTSEIDSKKVWKGQGNGLYVGKSNSDRDKITVTSKLCASYSMLTSSIQEAKRIKTVLMVCDTSSDSELDTYFDAWEIDGNIIVDKYFKKNQTTGKDKPKINKATIKLGSFMKHGVRAETVIPLEGIENWKRRVSKFAPKL